MSREHALFLVDQSAGNDVRRYVDIIKNVARECDDFSYDVVTYSSKARNRVIRNVGSMKFRQVGNPTSNLWSSMSEAVDDLGKRLSLEKDKPDHVIVFVITDKMDSGDDTDVLDKLVESVSEQKWVWRWTFIIASSARWEIKDALGLMDSDIMSLGDNADEIMVRLIHDLHEYGSCGTFAEDR